MARFLFTTILANDLGVPSRSLPIAIDLEKRGHKVAFCNPLEAPSRFIKSAGFENLPLLITEQPGVFPPITPEIWDYDYFISLFGCLDDKYVQHAVNAFIDVIQNFDADVVVDSFTPVACIAARACKRPLVTIIQGDLYPTGKGFIWWKEPPADLPSPVTALNTVLSKYGLSPITKGSQLAIGDLTLCAGIPETDPIPSAPDVIYMGPLFGSQMYDKLPNWIDEFAGNKPLIWVYCGNPRYFGAEFAGPADSVVVLKAVFEGLSDREVNVIITLGHQERPKDLPPPPNNFREANYLPGVSLAKRSDLMVHHGGHGSCMTGAYAGTPSLIIPTYSERESNARRLAGLGVAELMIPLVDETGEKHVNSKAFKELVFKMLSDPQYKTSAAALSKRMENYIDPEGIADRIEALL